MGVLTGLIAVAAGAFVLLGQAGGDGPSPSPIPPQSVVSEVASVASEAGTVVQPPIAARAAASEAAPVGSASQAAAVEASPKPTGPVAVTKCVSAMFPPETFDGLQDLSFACHTPDGKRGTRLMRQRIVLGSRGKLTDGMKEWSRLGWHELAVYGIVRKTCCATGEPLVLPPPVQSCLPVDRAVEALAEAFDTRASDLRDRLVEFQRAADCAYYAKAPGYQYQAGPISGGQIVFEEFLKRNGR